MRAMFSTACSPGAPSISFILARPRSYFLSSGMRAPCSSGESAVIEKEKPQVSRLCEAAKAPDVHDFRREKRRGDLSYKAGPLLRGALGRAEAKGGDEIGAGGVRIGVLIFLAHDDAL